MIVAPPQEPATAIVVSHQEPTTAMEQEIEEADAQAAAPNVTLQMQQYAAHCRRELRAACALARLAGCAADDAAAAAAAAKAAASQAMARSIHADKEFLGIPYPHLDARSPSPPLEEGGPTGVGVGRRSPAQET